MLLEPLDDLPLPPAGEGTSDWRWLVEQLLRRAHHELDRADEKLNTLFRLYGVVLAAGVGFSVSGLSRKLTFPAGAVLVLAAVLAIASGGLLASALAPRERPTPNGHAPGFFGDVVRLANADRLLNGLEAGAAALDTWLVEQLVVVSRIVQQRYRLIRRATVITWVAIVLTLIAAVLQRVT